MLGTELEIKVERLWARLGEVGRDLGKRLVRKARLSFRNAMRKQHAINCIKHTNSCRQRNNNKNAVLS